MISSIPVRRAELHVSAIYPKSCNNLRNCDIKQSESTNQTPENTTQIIKNINVLPGERILYKFTIENIGETKDTFRIFTDGVPEEWLTILYSITVNAGETTTDYAEIAIPNDLALIENVTYNFTIYIIGKSRDKKTISFTIQPTKDSIKNYLKKNEIENEPGVNTSDNLTDTASNKTTPKKSKLATRSWIKEISGRN